MTFFLISARPRIVLAFIRGNKQKNVILFLRGSTPFRAFRFRLRKSRITCKQIATNTRAVVSTDVIGRRTYFIDEKRIGPTTFFSRSRRFYAATPR